MSKKIRIQSTQTIIVSPDLKVKDLSDTTSLAPNRLRAVMDWNDSPVKIIAGVGEYDAKIKNWFSVKKLVEAEILTIMEIPGQDEPVEKQIEKPKKEDKKNLKLGDLANEN